MATTTTPKSNWIPPLIITAAIVVAVIGLFAFAEGRSGVATAPSQPSSVSSSKDKDIDIVSKEATGTAANKKSTSDKDDRKDDGKPSKKDADKPEDKRDKDTDKTSSSSQNGSSSSGSSASGGSSGGSGGSSSSGSGNGSSGGGSSSGGGATTQPPVTVCGTCQNSPYHEMQIQPVYGWIPQVTCSCGLVFNSDAEWSIHNQSLGWGIGHSYSATSYWGQTGTQQVSVHINCPACGRR